jgi:hypothetical protein
MKEQKKRFTIFDYFTTYNIQYPDNPYPNWMVNHASSGLTIFVIDEEVKMDLHDGVGVRSIHLTHQMPVEFRDFFDSVLDGDREDTPAKDMACAGNLLN